MSCVDYVNVGFVMKFLDFCRGGIDTQQYRSLRGMLKSNSIEAQKGAVRFLVKYLHESYPSDKDKFHFGFDGYTWRDVDRLRTYAL